MDHAQVSRVPDLARALRSPRLIDAFFVVITLASNVGGVLAVARHDGSAELPGLFDLLLLTIAPALLWWRRRFPGMVLAGCVAASWTFFFLGSSDGPIYLPMIVSLVSAITHGARLAAYALVAGTLIFRLAPLVIPEVEAPSLSSTTGLAAWLAFLVALGELIRHRRALTESRHQRLLAGLDAQADQIRREAAEQRLGLARDLHDVIGHQLTVINIQAKAGLQLRASGKPGVTDSLEAVREASG